MRFVWQFLAVAAVGILGGQTVAAVQGNPWLTLALGLLTAVVAVLVYGWVVRRTEHRPPVEMAWKGAGATTGLWTLAGIALFALVIMNIAFLGGYEVSGLGSVTGMVGLFGFMAAAAVTEELVFRGVLFRLLEEYGGTWIALALSSALFGLVHLPNENSSLWGVTVIALGGSTMLTAAYVATRNLWVPIGLHFGWNLAASGIFSTEVSGNDTPQGLLDASTSGPTLLSGGAFGPEASLYALVFPLLATVVFMWLARRRGLVVPRRRADRAGTSPTLPR